MTVRQFSVDLFYHDHVAIYRGVAVNGIYPCVEGIWIGDGVETWIENDECMEARVNET